MNNHPSKSDFWSSGLHRAYSGRRVMILGSAGFIGRWVARELSRAKAELFLPVRDLTMAQEIFDSYEVRGNIFGIDLLDGPALMSVYRDTRPVITFNLAGYGVDRVEQDEVLAYATNVGLISTICSAAAEFRSGDWSGSDIVHAGTAMEYGQIRGNLDEDSVPRPSTLYGRSKLAGTRVLAENCRRLRLKGITARLFSVYGAGEGSVRLLPTLMRARHTTGPIPLTAGSHKRDFVHVEDVARAMVALGIAPSQDSGVVNVATGLLTSVRTFTETAADALGIERHRLQFGALPTRAEEMEHEPVAVGRLQKLIGWRPSTSIAEGTIRTRAFADVRETIERVEVCA